MIRKAVVLSILLLAMVSKPYGKAGAEEVVVSAASSLTDAFREIGIAFERANKGVTLRFNFGASGALQRQIEQGAPVDVFASAGVKEMDALAQEKRIETAGRINFAGNRLVLIIPLHGTVKSWKDLTLPAIRRIAISNPASVPSGRYAQATLTRRGLWSVVQSKCILGENVRQTLTYVANGDVDAGLVFVTDAKQVGNRVHIVQTAVEGVDHAPIVYPAATVDGGAHGKAARRFILFLKAGTARSLLRKFGFSMPHAISARTNP